MISMLRLFWPQRTLRNCWSERIFAAQQRRTAKIWTATYGRAALVRGLNAMRPYVLGHGPGALRHYAISSSLRESRFSIASIIASLRRGKRVPSSMPLRFLIPATLADTVVKG